MNTPKNKKLTVPTEEQLKRDFQDAGAGGFSLDEHEGQNFTFSTRDNGDVGEETPGAEDIRAGRAAIQHLSKIYPKAKLKIDTVDEWVHVEITFPYKGSPEPQDLAQTVGDRVVELFQKNGFQATLKKFDHQTTTYGEYILVYVESEGILLHYKNEEIESFSELNMQIRIEKIEKPNQPPVTRMKWYSTKLRDNKDFPETSLDGTLENTRAETEKAFELMIQTITKDGSKLSQKLWKTTEYVETPPEGSVLVGKSGYDGPDDYCTFHKLPSGDFLYIDTDSKITYEIPAENFLTVIKFFDEFYPEAPKGYQNMRELLYDLKKELEETISKEAAEGKTTTIEILGKPMNIFIGVDGSFHFGPVKKEEK